MKISILLVILALLFADRAQSQSITNAAATNLTLPPFHVPNEKLTPAQNATVISNCMVELQRWQATNSVILRRIESSATNQLNPAVVNARSMWAIGEHRQQTYAHFLNHLRLQMKYETSIKPAKS
jgi:hypothetical protein